MTSLGTRPKRVPGQGARGLSGLRPRARSGGHAGIGCAAFPEDPRRLERHGRRAGPGRLADRQALEGARGMDVFHRPRSAAMGRLPRLPPHQCHGTENVIAACRKTASAAHSHQHSSVIFNGRDLQGWTNPRPTRCAIPPLPADQGLGRAGRDSGRSDELNTIVLRPHQIWGPEIRISSPDLARARSSGASATPEPGRHDLHRQRRGSPSAGADAAQIKTSPLWPGVLHQPGRTAAAWDMIDAILKRPASAVKGQFRIGSPWMAGLIFEKIYSWLRLPGEPPMTLLWRMRLPYPLVRHPCGPAGFCDTSRSVIG